MDWRHYESRETGKACVIEGKYSYTCTFHMGQITTGKQRVYHGFFVRIHLHDGTLVTGEDRHTLRDALFDLNRLLEGRGMLLLAAGLEPRFSESGLSFNSGFGAYTDRGYQKVVASDLNELRGYARRVGSPDGSFSKACGLCQPE